MREVKAEVPKVVPCRRACARRQTRNKLRLRGGVGAISAGSSLEVPVQIRGPLSFVGASKLVGRLQVRQASKQAAGAASTSQLGPPHL